jgi:peroxiredoxin
MSEGNPNVEQSEKKPFFQGWMILLIIPLIGMMGMILILISDGNNDSDGDNNSQNSAASDVATPLPQTVPPLPTFPPVMDEPVPDIQLVDLEGNIFSLQDFAGRPIVLNFWATWCAPCIEEMPEFQEYSDAQDDDGVVVIAVTDPNNGQNMDLIREFIAENDLTFRIGIDPESELHSAMSILEMGFLPVTLFIDADGIVRTRLIRQVDIEILEAEVALLETTDQ